MKLLITGISGNIGNVLSQQLKKNNISFTGLDIINQDISNKHFIQLDFTNSNELNEKKSLLEKFDTLIHLASKINNENDICQIGTESINVNIIGTLNLLDYLPNLKNVLFASTYMVYGPPMQNPIQESHALNPQTVYGASKATMEKYLQIYTKEKRIDLGIFRYMGIYGLTSHYANQAIHNFIKLIQNDKNPIIYGNGLQRRNHLFIDDAIDSILAWLNNKQPGIFNIGGTDSPTNLDLISMINQKMGKRIEPIFKNQEQYDLITDISKAADILHFQPKTKIEDGINKTVENFCRQRF
jgi:UDP-glucose 4-epimerase